MELSRQEITDIFFEPENKKNQFFKEVKININNIYSSVIINLDNLNLTLKSFYPVKVTT